MKTKIRKKSALVLGGGGFIGGHLAKRLKEEGFWVRIVDIKHKHEYFNHNDICNDYVAGDLRDPKVVEAVFRIETDPNHKDVIYNYNFYKQPFTNVEAFDEVYQLAADMGGAGYIFTGDNDANVMHNSALVNLNVVNEATKTGVGRIFYSSSACMYPEHNQLDPDNPNCEESSAYPADPDSEYGWEKLFSERLYFAFNRNYNLDVRVARYHNIFGPEGTYDGGREKAPAAMCRKAIQAGHQGAMEVWGDGQQTRSFLYIDECIEAVRRLMESEVKEVLNIGSDEMIKINDLATMAIGISGNDILIKNIPGPEGVRGRNSDNTLIKGLLGWAPSQPLREGMEKTYKWIEEQIAL